jgi:hypothetical protein
MTSSSSQSMVQAATALASTMAFAIEGPAGLFVAGVLQAAPILLFGLLGGSDSPAVMLQSFESAVGELLTEQQLKAAATDVQANTDWLALRVKELPTLGTGDAFRAALEGDPATQTPGWIADLATVASRDSDLRSNLISLNDLTLLEDQQLGATALDLLVSGTGLYLVLLKQRMEWQLWLCQHDSSPPTESMAQTIVAYAALRPLRRGFGPFRQSRDAAPSRLTSIGVVVGVDSVDLHDDICRPPIPMVRPFAWGRHACHSDPSVGRIDDKIASISGIRPSSQSVPAS